MTQFQGFSRKEDVSLSQGQQDLVVGDLPIQVAYAQASQIPNVHTGSLSAFLQSELRLRVFHHLLFSMTQEVRLELDQQYRSAFPQRRLNGIQWAPFVLAVQLLAPTPEQILRFRRRLSETYEPSTIYSTNLVLQS